MGFGISVPGNRQQTDSDLYPPSLVPLTYDREEGEDSDTCSDISEASCSSSDDELEYEILAPDKLDERMTLIVVELKEILDYSQGDGVIYQEMLYHIVQQINNNVVALANLGDTLAETGYPDTAVTILKQTKDAGFFSGQDPWDLTRYTYSLSCTFSDVSEHFALSLAKAGAVDLMSDDVGRTPGPEVSHANLYRTSISECALRTLHSIARCAGITQYFKSTDTLEVLRLLLDSRDPLVKALSVLTLAYIEDDLDEQMDVEKNSNYFIDVKKTIESLIQWLRAGVRSKGERCHLGFMSWQLTKGLAKLALKDSHKHKIVSGGTLRECVYMLRQNDPMVQACSVQCIWTLSFKREIKQKILDCQGLVRALESLKDSEVPFVKKHVEASLWDIKGEDISAARDLSCSEEKYVLVSYSWSEQSLVTRIQSSLNEAGCRCWIDRQTEVPANMPQCPKEAMAKCSVVLVCVSAGYTENNFCRSEFEYAHRLGKVIIPIMVQRRYRLDNWLGTLLGARVYYDFTGQASYLETLERLLTELKNHDLLRPPQNEEGSNASIGQETPLQITVETQTCTCSTADVETSTDGQVGSFILPAVTSEASTQTAEDKQTWAAQARNGENYVPTTIEQFSQTIGETTKSTQTTGDTTKCIQTEGDTSKFTQTDGDTTKFTQTTGDTTKSTQTEEDTTKSTQIGRETNEGTQTTGKIDKPAHIVQYLDTENTERYVQHMKETWKSFQQTDTTWESAQFKEIGPVSEDVNAEKTSIVELSNPGALWKSTTFSSHSKSATSTETMRKKDVKNWLVSQGLWRYTQGLCQVNGQLLWQLKKMKDATPAFFNTTVQRQFGMSLMDNLKFNEALDKLK